MSDEETEYYFNGVKLTEDQWMRMQVGHEQAMIQQEDIIMGQYAGISRDTAAAIQYLRSRHRWTWEKEKELADRDLAGDPIPLSDVLSGEY